MGTMSLALLEVCTDAERLRRAGGDDDRPHGGVLLEHPRRPTQRVRHRGRHGIHGLRAVEDELGHVLPLAVPLDPDQDFTHGVPSSGGGVTGALRPPGERRSARLHHRVGGPPGEPVDERLLDLVARGLEVEGQPPG